MSLLRGRATWCAPLQLGDDAADGNPAQAVLALDAGAGKRALPGNFRPPLTHQFNLDGA